MEAEHATSHPQTYRKSAIYVQFPDGKTTYFANLKSLKHFKTAIFAVQQSLDLSEKLVQESSDF